MNVIRVENIGKRYRVGAEAGGLLRDRIAGAFRDPLGTFRRKPHETFWAVRDVSFDVQEGEVLGLIGRNGAGKSTLLKILSRITKPTVGRAEIHGRVGSLLEVGTGFHQELSGRENVFLNGAILGMSRREITRKFDEIVAFAEVEKFIDTAVKHYSSGMYVRLAFAVAAHLETEILFVDEVLSVGDVSFQKKCLGKMGDVARQGRTIIFVSHNINAVATLCTSAMLLEKGQISLYSRDNIGEVLGRYMSPKTAEHTVDLTRHPNRVSRGAFFEQISICDRDCSPSNCFAPGESILIDLRVSPASRVALPKVSVGFTNYRGERVFAISTNIGGNAIPVISGPSTVRVRFALPPLMPGEYSLDVGLYDRTGAPLDEIYGSTSIKILKDADFALVDEHNPGMGHILVASSWSCSDGEGIAGPRTVHSTAGEGV